MGEAAGSRFLKPDGEAAAEAGEPELTQGGIDVGH